MGKWSGDGDHVRALNSNFVRFLGSVPASLRGGRPGRRVAICPPRLLAVCGTARSCPLIADDVCCRSLNLTRSLPCGLLATLLRSESAVAVEFDLGVWRYRFPAAHPS